jgi:hypothetical protein
MVDRSAAENVPPIKKHTVQKTCGLSAHRISLCPALGAEQIKHWGDANAISLLHGLLLTATRIADFRKC